MRFEKKKQEKKRKKRHRSAKKKKKNGAGKSGRRRSLYRVLDDDGNRKTEKTTQRFHRGENRKFPNFQSIYLSIYYLKKGEKYRVRSPKRIEPSSCWFLILENYRIRP